MNDPHAPYGAKRAAWALAGSGKAALPAFVAGLTNQQGRAREAILYCIGNLGTNASPAGPVLIQCLKDKDQTVAVRAAWVLGRLPLEPALVVPALTTGVQDSRSEVRHAAGEALFNRSSWSNFRGSSGPLAVGLIECLSDDDEAFKTNALRALGNLTNQSGLVVPALTKCLQDSRPASRASAAEALAQFRAEAHPALPALLPLLEDRDRGVREVATNALRRIDPEALERGLR